MNYFIKKLVATCYEGFPAVEVHNCFDKLEKIVINKTSMSMMKFMQWLADDLGMEIISMKGQMAYLDY